MRAGGWRVGQGDDKLSATVNGRNGDHDETRGWENSMIGRKRRTGALATSLIVLAMVALTGCGSDGRPLTTLDPRGQASTDIHKLVVPVFIVAGIVFVFVNLGVLFVAIKFRRKDEDEFPEQVHGNTKLELGWTILPAVIMAGIAVGTIATLFNIANEPDDIAQDFEVTVVGQQWWWSFEYDLGRDGTIDFVTASEMVIPTGTPVKITTTSRDVIHSFWIPALNGKKDAAPGRNHPFWLNADAPGRYLGQCTEFCGLSHGYMRMLVEARDQGDFEAWVADQMKPAAIPAASDEAARRGLEVFTGACTSCHQVRGVNSNDCTPITSASQYDVAKNTCWVGAQPYAGAAQVSGYAPDLTHLMSRYLFVGALYDLRGPTTGELNRAELEGWIRNPDDYKPMLPEATGDNKYGRGMPKVPLTEDQIDDLVAYLSTLK